MKKGLIMDSNEKMLQAGLINFPQLPNLIEGGGFSIELWLTVDKIEAGQQILNTIGLKHKGLQVSLAENNVIKMTINDGEAREKNIGDERQFVSDENTLKEGQLHHVVFNIDGAAKIATIIIDGVLSDGGESRSYGWGRIYPYLSDLNDTNKCTFNDSFEGKIHHIRVYNRALKTSEAIANYHAGLK